MRIEQKWGFGMAPVRPDVQHERLQAVEAVLNLLETGQVAPGVEDDVSTVKGLLNRSWRQDQWDWFTVWTQLGRPARRRCAEMGYLLVGLRSMVQEGGDEVPISYDYDEVIQVLRWFLLEEEEPPRDAGHGYIYILSTREQPDLLKIGYTDRRVEQRVAELNRHTAVAVPYGVRAMWTVKQASALEHEIHRELDDYRVRGDREFFELDFMDACHRIEALIDRSAIEL